MNWGHKITLVFVAFVVMMVYMVVRSFQANVDLVSEDYYLEELNYQEQIDKKKNVREGNKQIEYRLTKEGIELAFPQLDSVTDVGGTINLYRPSEADMDFTFEVNLDSLQRYNISADNLSSGKYILKVEWTDGETPYYQEIEVFIPGA